jgi:hypothetical protein
MGFDKLTESIEYSEETEMLIRVIEKL